MGPLGNGNPIVACKRINRLAERRSGKSGPANAKKACTSDKQHQAEQSYPFLGNLANSSNISKAIDFCTV
jgi:hypothetical protein